ncbi:MAG: hypothetical protein ONB37_19350, partial [candidate division KSB1 bacterium]|nr:hypothetical protein [candidate division KSB1 bacterium]
FHDFLFPKSDVTSSESKSVGTWIAPFISSAIPVMNDGDNDSFSQLTASTCFSHVSPWTVPVTPGFSQGVAPVPSSYRSRFSGLPRWRNESANPPP